MLLFNKENCSRSRANEKNNKLETNQNYWYCKFIFHIWNIIYYIGFAWRNVAFSLYKVNYIWIIDQTRNLNYKEKKLSNSINIKHFLSQSFQKIYSSLLFSIEYKWSVLLSCASSYYYMNFIQCQFTFVMVNAEKIKHVSSTCNNL